MRKESIGTVAVALVFALSACGEVAQTSAPTAAPEGETSGAEPTESGEPTGAAEPTDAALSVDELTVAYGIIPEPQGVAHQLGWFEEELGVPINWITLEGGAATIAAMQSGDVDIGCGTGTPPLTAGAAQGIPLAIFWIQDNAPQSLVVQADSGIEDVADLSGTRISTIVGSTMYYDLVVALNQEGVPLDEVEILDAPVEEAVAAFRRGDIDGAFIIHPFIGQLVSEGAVELFPRQELFERYGYALFDACFVTQDFANEHQDVLARWVAVEQRALEFLESNRDEALAAIAELIDITPEEAATGVDAADHPTTCEQVEPEWMNQPGAEDSGIAGAIRTTAALAFGLGRIPELPSDPQSIVDSRAVAEVCG